jgi:glycosyltransferase involved in cell wall biosynthesis
MNLKRKNVLIITYYSYPCTETVLDTVFADKLGRNVNIIWLFLGDTSLGKTLRWHNSTVLLRKIPDRGTMAGKVIYKLVEISEFLRLMRTIRLFDIDIVLVRDLPLFAFLMNLIKPLYGVKVYYQCTGVAGALETDYARHFHGARKLYYTFLGILRRYIDALAVHRSDMTLPITESHKQLIAHLASTEKIVPLTMGVSEEWLQRQRRRIPVLEELKRTHAVITYFGTLSFVRNPLFLLRTFLKVKEKISNCKLLLIGSPSAAWEQEALNRFCRDNNIEDDVIFTGQVGRDILQDHLQYCDLSLSLAPSNDFFRTMSPTKMYESLGCKVPVVGNLGIPEQDKVIRESGGGVLCDYTEDSACDAIVKLLEDPAARIAMAEAGSEYVINNYSYSIIANRILKYFA